MREISKPETTAHTVVVQQKQRKWKGQADTWVLGWVHVPF